MYVSLGSSCPGRCPSLGYYAGFGDDVPTPGQQSPPIAQPATLFTEREAAGVKYRAVEPYYKRLVHSDLIAFDRQSEVAIAGGALFVGVPYAPGVDPARNPHGTYDAWRWVEARIPECGLKTVPCLQPTGILVEPSFTWEAGTRPGQNVTVKLYASTSPAVLAAVAGPGKTGFVLYEPPQGWIGSGGTEPVAQTLPGTSLPVPKWVWPTALVGGAFAIAAYLGLRR